MSGTTTLRVEFGYASPHFLAADSAISVQHARPWIVILAYPEVSLPVLLPLLEAILPTGRPVAFFCAGIDPELRAMLIVNHQQGALRNVAIDAPAGSEYDRAQLFAVAAATGARVIGSNHVLARTTIDMLGEADSITVDALATVLSLPYAA